jgi:hypothetical protein
MAYKRYYNQNYKRNYTSKPKAKDIRIEYPSRGATYNNPVYGVYEYDEYPYNSVLAGQTRRSFLNSFETLEEAQKEYPNASLHGCGYEPVNIPKNPPAWFDEANAGERWDDDY